MKITFTRDLIARINRDEVINYGHERITYDISDEDIKAIGDRYRELLLEESNL